VSNSGLDVGAYLGPLGFGMVVASIMFFPVLGIAPAIMGGIVFFILLTFFNSVDREIKKQNRIESRRSRRYWRRRYWRR
jgi:hypothetical protein